MTQKNDDIFKLRSLAIEKEQARENVKDDISQTKERLRPSNLIQEAKDKALERVQKTGETALQGVKDNPGKVASIAAAAAVLALRKPVTNYLANRNADNDGAKKNDAEE